MNQAESPPSNADIDGLLFDLMKVVRAQHHLHSSGELQLRSNKVWFNVGQSAALYTGLGLKPQSPEVQWMLIIKLYREFCLDPLGMYKDGTPLDQDKLMMDYFIDYRTLDDEVLLDILPMPFVVTYERLERQLAKQNSSIKPVAESYTCRLWPDDNKLMLDINGDSFQVARLNDGGTMTKLLTQLQKMPSGRPLTAIEFAPLDNYLNFNQLLAKNSYSWLMPMLSVNGTKRIALRNPSEMSFEKVVDMVSKINEKYRKPIQEHLDIGQ